MRANEIELTPTDRMILASYKNMVEGLSDYLGEGYEIVLHSLENYQKSIIKIINGHYTGRTEGAPITDLALDMLAKIRQNCLEPYISYNTFNKDGAPMHSATIAIHGENNRIIGLLCINFYLNTPLYNVIGNWVSQATESRSTLAESFSDDIDDVITNVTNEVLQTVMADPSISASKKKRAIVAELNNRGVFNIKDAVSKVAEMLGTTRNTVYTYLRS